MRVEKNSVRNVILAAATVLVACSTPNSFVTYKEIELKIEGVTLPEGAIDQVPVRLGIYYDRWFLQYKVSEIVDVGDLSVYENKRYIIDIGQASAKLIDEAVSLLFSETLRLKERLPGVSTGSAVDAILHPFIKGVNFDHASSVTYAFKLYSSCADLIDEWTVTGTAPSAKSADDLAAAMRSAAAGFLATFASRPKVKSWLLQMDEVRNPRGNEPSD